MQGLKPCHKCQDMWQIARPQHLPQLIRNVEDCKASTPTTNFKTYGRLQGLKKYHNFFMWQTVGPQPPPQILRNVADSKASTPTQFFYETDCRASILATKLKICDSLQGPNPYHNL